MSKGYKVPFVSRRKRMVMRQLPKKLAALRRCLLQWSGLVAGTALRAQKAIADVAAALRNTKEEQS